MKHHTHSPDYVCVHDYEQYMFLAPFLLEARVFFCRTLSADVLSCEVLNCESFSDKYYRAMELLLVTSSEVTQNTLVFSLKLVFNNA